MSRGCTTRNFSWVPIPSMLSKKHWDVRGPVISPKYPQQCQTVYPILSPWKQLLHCFTQRSTVGEMEEWLMSLLTLTLGWIKTFVQNKYTQILLRVLDLPQKYRVHIYVVFLILSSSHPRLQLQILLVIFHLSSQELCMQQSLLVCWVPVEGHDENFSQCWVCYLFRNSTYCMKVSMSMTVEESDEGKCFSSKIRHLEKAEITHSKMITCPDIEDYLAPYKQPQMTWYKVRYAQVESKSSVDCCTVTWSVCVSCQECERVEWRSSITVNTTHIWIPEVEEGDGGNYTCELQYGSRLVRRTTELKVTGRTHECMDGWSHKEKIYHTYLGIVVWEMLGREHGKEKKIDLRQYEKKVCP